MKIPKKYWGGGSKGGGGSGLGVRVDVNEGLKFGENSQKKKLGGGVRVGGSGWM